MLFAITASICLGGTTRAFPSFYLDGALLLLADEHEAAAYAARFIIDPFDQYDHVNVTACPLSEYLTRCGVEGTPSSELERIVREQVEYQSTFHNSSPWE